MSSENKPRIVYKLVRTDKPKDGTDVYVGSTSLSLKTRLQYHRGHAKVGNSRLYKRMFEVGVDNWQILPLVIHRCGEKEIRTLEKNWIEILKPDLNTFSPIDTENKWYNNKKKVNMKNFCLKSLETKRYYCKICEKAFCHSGNLQRHLKSSRHFWKYIYSVD